MQFLSLPGLAAPASPVFAFALSYALLAMLPGPNFLVVLRAGLLGSRRESLITALGVATGAAALAFLAATVLRVLLQDGHPPIVLNLLFGGMLVFMGARMAMAATGLRTGPAREVPRIAVPHAALGFVTALANPVTATFFATTSLRLGAGPQAPGALGLACVTFAVAAGWFPLLAYGLTLGGVRQVYLRLARPAALVCGLMLAWQGVTALAAAQL